MSMQDIEAAQQRAADQWLAKHAMQGLSRPIHNPQLHHGHRLQHRGFEDDLDL